MSDPAPTTPRPETTSHQEASETLSARLEARRQRERRDRRMLLGISVLFHVVVLLVLVFLTPWQDLIDRAEAVVKTPEPMSREKVRQIDEVMREVQERELRQQVEVLRVMREQMDEIEQQQEAQYEPFRAEQEREAPALAVEAAEAALAAMREAQTALQAGELVEARNHQSNAEQLQDEALGRLTMLDAARADASVAQAVGAAVSQQREAKQTQTQASDERTTIETGLEQRKQAERSLSTEARRAKDASGRVAREAREVAKNATSLEKKQAELDKLAKQAASETDARKLKGIEQNTARRTREANALEDRLKRAEAKQADEQRKLEAQEAKRDAAQAKVDAAQAAIEAAGESTQTTQAEAIAQQEQVLALVKAAADAAKAQDAPEAGDSDTAAATQPEGTQVAVKKPAESLDGKSLAELYAEAQKAEQALTDAFENVRAMELAVIRDTSVELARESVDDVTPVRPDLDAATLTAQVSSAGGLEAKKQAVQTALEQTQSMVDLGSLLLGQLQRESEGAEDGASVGRLALRWPVRMRRRKVKRPTPIRMMPRTIRQHRPLPSPAGRLGTPRRLPSWT